MSALPPSRPGSVGERAAWAAYAVLRDKGLIAAGDWTVPHLIGGDAQAAWDAQQAKCGPKETPLPPQGVPCCPLPLPSGPVVSCNKCGVRWEGTMGYVCPDSCCPVQPKITC